MKTIFYTLCTLLFFANTIAQTPESWQQMQSLGTTALPREGAVGFSISAKAYIGTGRTRIGSLLNDFWEYDPSTNTWTQKADFAGAARYGATGFSIINKGYIGTGEGSVYYNDFWEYDPTLNTWTQKVNFSGGARSGATGFNIESKGYIGTGYFYPYYYTDFWEYNPATNSWTQKANFLGGKRCNATGLSIGSKGYIGMGLYHESTGYVFKNDFWEYNPITNHWTRKADFGGEARYLATGFNIDNKGYVGLGYTSYLNNNKNDFWQYDPITNVWIQKADFVGGARNSATGVSIGGKGYMGWGGDDWGDNDDFWEYDPANDIWVQKANIEGGSREYAIGFGIGSKGYVGLGVVAGSQKKDFWEYDPSNNVWTQKADFGGGTRRGTTGFSIGSKGYIGTGYDGSYHTKKDFWEYQPDSNIWLQKADFGGGARHSATGFSIDNKGYVGLGSDSNYLNKKDFWEYDPVTDLWIQKADFGGSARHSATGFNIGHKGYIGTGADNSLKRDFWEYDPNTNIWTQKADFGKLNSERYSAVGFSIGNKGYIGTGLAGSFPSTSKGFKEYDPITNIWTQKADFGGGVRTNATGFSIGNYGYIGFGNATDGIKNDWWRYSPKEGIPSITAVTDITGTNAIAHWYPVADAVSYTLCISSSTDSSTYSCYLPIADTVLQLINLQVVTQYNVKVVAVLAAGDSSAWSVPYSFTTASDGWKQVQSLGISATGRSGAASFSIGNKGYLGTGGGNLKDFWEYDLLTDVWTQKADFGGEGRSNATGFNIGSKGYIGTGYANAVYKRDFWEYDPASNAWTQKANLGGNLSGTGRRNATGFSIGSKGYIGTGYSGGYAYLIDFWEYDPDTDLWTQKANFGGASRTGAAGFSIGSKGYIGTGYSHYYNKTYFIDFWEYDPNNNSWTQKANFGGAPRSGATGFGTGNKGYLGTGEYNDYTNYANYSDFWEYNPVTDTWVQKADFAGGERSAAIGFSIGGKGYIGTGYDSVDRKDFWEYDPIGNHWTRKANFGGTARKYAAGFSIGSKGYMGTGLDDKNKKDFWEYDPLTNVWTQKADFAGVARYAATGFSIGNKGYIGTGSATDSIKNDFWEYNPTTNTWIRKADFGGVARYAATGFSIGNKGYIGTGYSGVPYFIYYRDFWEYDPFTDIWTQKANYGGAARGYATGFSIGSKGYIGTGNSAAGYTNDFWEYDPVTNAWTQKANFSGTARTIATGFSIGSKGYIGTGKDAIYPYYNKNDFWEYNPTTNTWTRKADFGGTSRVGATGFSIGNFGYIGFGTDDAGIKNDWWQYTNVNIRGIPVIVSVTNIAATKAVAHWYPVADAISYSVCVARTDSLKYACYLPVTDTLKQLTNLLPATQYNVQVKAIFGVGDSSVFSVPYTFTTTDTCIAPSNLKVTNITATAAKLNWKLPQLPVAGFQINYRAVGAGNWIKKQKPYPNTSINITGLTSNTNYEWRILSGCTSSQSAFAIGPNFTTLSAFDYALTIDDGIESISATENLSIKIIPNPGNGDFTMQVALPAKAAATRLLLYNNMGQKVWQQNAGNISGRLNKNISLRNILSNGVYLFVIERNDIKLSQKIVINK